MTQFGSLGAWIVSLFGSLEPWNVGFRGVLDRVTVLGVWFRTWMRWAVIWRLVRGSCWRGLTGSLLESGQEEA